MGIVKGQKSPKHASALSLPPRVGSGQFARLLPTLVMAAVSQAPSPEPNPNSPSPVVGIVVHDTTIYLMGQMLE